MALTLIKKSQLDALNLVNSDISASAAISTSKLADGANFILRNGTVPFIADQSFGGFRATNLAAPTSNTDAATKAYVDSVAQGLTTKTAVSVATTGNITLSGTQTIDGKALAVDERVLVKDQTNPKDNGVYLVKSGTWVRAADSDTGDELINAFYFVEYGTDNQATGWVQSTPGPIVLNPTTGNDIIFSQFSGAADYTAGAGLTKTGLTFDVGTASTSRIVVNADNIDLATTGVSAGTHTKLTVDAYGRVTNATDATTTDIAEGTRLYFTDARARGAISGGASSIASANLTFNRALISDGSGKVSVSTTTSTELSYLSGVSSSIQNQLNNKQAKSTLLSSIAGLNTNADTMIYFDGVDSAKVTDLTAFGRLFIAATSASAGRTALGLVIGTDIQAYDADLSAIATLSGTSGILRKTASNTWSLDTATYLTSNQTITLSGDATGSGSTGIQVTLANSGVTSGSYGSATQVPVFTVDAKGRVTSVTNTAINLVSTLGGLQDVTVTTPADGQILQYVGGSTNKWVNTAPNFLTENETITIGGTDFVGGSGKTSITLALGTTGVVAGDYTKVTVDAKGRVTFGDTLTVNDLPGGTINIANIKTRETPSPLPNGTAGPYTAQSAAFPDTEQVYLNGVLMEPGAGNDYTVVAQNPLSIQFTFNVTSQDKIRISYISL